MKEQTVSYTDAYKELQSIVKKMEDANISVDDLSENIERASLLIKICRDKLTKTEDEIKKIVETEP